MSEQLSRSLRELAEEPSPLIAVDAERACREGRRLRRRRRTSGVVACAGVLAVAAATVPLAGSSPKAVQVTESDAAARGSDPLVAPGVFGWLSSAVGDVSYSLHSRQFSVVAKGARAYIWLTVYDRKPDSGRFPDGGRQRHVRAPSVNGGQAFWVTHTTADPTNGGDAFLVWQTSSGKWAEVHGYYLDKSTIQATLRRVAEHARIGEVQVPLPVSIRGLPSSAQTVEADLWRRGTATPQAWRLDLAFQVGGAMLSVDVSPAGQSKPTGAARCATSNGLDICVAGPGLSPAQITSLGPDPAHWTTTVLTPQPSSPR